MMRPSKYDRRRQVDEIVLSQHECPIDSECVDQINQDAEHAQRTTKRVRPQRNVGVYGLSFSSMSCPGAIGRRRFNELVHLFDGHFHTQVAIAHRLAGFLFERQCQIYQAETVETQFPQSLVDRDSRDVGGASHDLADRIVRRVAGLNVHGGEVQRSWQQVPTYLQHGCTRKVGFGPPGGTGKALVLCKARIGIREKCPAVDRSWWIRRIR